VSPIYLVNAFVVGVFLHSTVDAVAKREYGLAALKALYPADNGATVELPGHLIDLDHEREEIAEQLKALGARKQEIDAAFKAAIGEASVGVLLNGVSYTHRLTKRDGYTVKPTEFRTLRRSAPKKGK